MIASESNATPNAGVDTAFRPSRTFTKRMIIATFTLAWALIFYALYLDRVASVIGPASIMITTMFGIYTGIGHLDLRSLVTEPKK